MEKTLRALSELVDEGKIGWIALSEFKADTIGEAANITKIVAVKVKLSLSTTKNRAFFIRHCQRRR